MSLPDEKRIYPKWPIFNKLCELNLRSEPEITT